VDPAEVSKLVTATVPLVGELKQLLPRLTTEVKKIFAERGRPDLSTWWKRVHEWKEKWPLKIKQEGEEQILPQTAIRKIWEKAQGRNAIVTTGVGEHQMWAAQFWEVSKPREFITSGGLGTMGVCLPFAIGMQLARPDAMVIGIDGDGSFQMTLQDLATAVDLKLPIKIFVINNLFLGMVRQWQELFYEQRFSETPLTDCPDLVKLAEAYKCLGLRARTLEELEPVIEKALAHQDGPCIVDIRVKRQEKVYPMVPAGAPLNDMIGGE
jgi:acetolactate synthase-1/2/3 large subunit